MVKLQDFVIAAFLFMAVMLGGIIFFADAENYDKDPFTHNNLTFIEIDKINELTTLTQQTEANLSNTPSSALDNIAKLFRQPIAAVSIMKASTGILFGFFTNITAVYGIDERFTAIIIGILLIIFAALVIALLTGRFV